VYRILLHLFYAAACWFVLIVDCRLREATLYTE
jgi:hypothetical protein